MKNPKKPGSPAEPAKSKPSLDRASSPDRRDFFTRAAAVVIGGLVALFPPLAGLAMFLDPLRRKSQSGQFIRVADLKEVPPDGIPRSFSVIADRWDAWNFYPQEPIGAVYLRRTEEGGAPEAVSAICPHLGCFVDFRVSQGNYKCPCHDSRFEPDGARIDPDNCPAARDLDSLEVEVRNENEVWVKYQRFVAQKAEKIPEA
jgi:menaquinol-cytochrome c reductase iron-sulfur subunit